MTNCNVCGQKARYSVHKLVAHCLVQLPDSVAPIDGTHVLCERPDVDLCQGCMDGLASMALTYMKLPPVPLSGYVQGPFVSGMDFPHGPISSGKIFV